MAVTTNFEFNLLFEDDTTKTLTIGPLNPEKATSTISALKANVMEFEDNFTSDTAKLMTSKYGNDWAGFESVKIVTTDKNVIF